MRPMPWSSGTPVDLAKIRKVMYFLITFSEGLEPTNLKASMVFNQL